MTKAEQFAKVDSYFQVVHSPLPPQAASLVALYQDLCCDTALFLLKPPGPIDLSAAVAICLHLQDVTGRERHRNRASPMAGSGSGLAGALHLDDWWVGVYSRL